MNLTSIFRKDAAIKDAAVTNLEWLQDGIIHPGEPQLDLSGVKKHNNIKPELEVQWGNAPGAVDLNEPAGEVKRNVPEEAQMDAGPVILFARDMMNRGSSISKVASALKAKYDLPTLKKAKAGLTELFKMDGIIGRIAVDGRGYESCKDAYKAASNSPYKRFIKYAIGCCCGDPCMMPVNQSELMGDVVTESTGNPMDDFLASKQASEVKKVACCRSTMLPILSGDLSPNEMDDTLVEVMNVTGMPPAVKEQIASKNASNMAKVKAAFRWLDRNAAEEQEKKYSDKPKACSGYQMKGDLTDLQLDAPVQDMSDVDMGLFMEPEFEGTDVVELDTVTAPASPLDVSMVQDMTL